MTTWKALLAGSILALAVVNTGSQASAQTISRSAILLGGNECDSTAPPAGPICRKGDPRGFGRATVTFPTGTTICVTVQVDNLAGVTLAHIHQGRETVNGPVVFSIIPPNPAIGGNPGVTALCGAPPAAVITGLRNDPAGFYVNVHNGT
jgi:hypothetical protein